MKMKIERGESEDECILKKSKEQALITDLQKTDTLIPFCEQYKKNHPQLYEVSTKRNARLVLNIGQMELCIAQADIV